MHFICKTFLAYYNVNTSYQCQETIYIKMYRGNAVKLFIFRISLGLPFKLCPTGYKGTLRNFLVEYSSTISFPQLIFSSLQPDRSPGLITP